MYMYMYIVHVHVGAYCLQWVPHTYIYLYVPCIEGVLVLSATVGSSGIEACMQKLVHVVYHMYTYCRYMYMYSIHRNTYV